MVRAPQEGPRARPGRVRRHAKEDYRNLRMGHQVSVSPSPALPRPPHSLPRAAVINVDQEMLFEIILAANYLDIKPLLYVSLPSRYSSTPPLVRLRPSQPQSDAFHHLPLFFPLLFRCSRRYPNGPLTRSTLR